MMDLKTLYCYNCEQVIFNLPSKEVEKMDGLSFMCECCGHINLLKDHQLCLGRNHDKSMGISNIFEMGVIL